ncbi:3-dehydroquinate synthase II [Methanococcus voltae]|uniref:3-dehydroquinate synthase n=1 Tax=Methanococcus voltae (strain ATCC BAA-1334 / A3) TaxID=456320 RepID=D7DQF4_METV3|nr:3-dehydroquinate synthase II [Methanococcus voltae]MCS3901685.1 3-dehydroquinate synthase II [Methanococcus voltae]
MASKFGFIYTVSNEWDEIKETVTDSLESSVNSIIIPKITDEQLNTLKKLGKMNIISKNLNSDIILLDNDDITEKLEENIEIISNLKKDVNKKIAILIKIMSKNDEVMASELSKTGLIDYIILEGKDWNIIPLENLIADLFTTKIEIVSLAKGVKDAEVAYEILEKGVDGVALASEDINEIKKFSELISKLNSPNLKMDIATVKKVEPIGSGDRVCIDTCSMLNIGEGMLIGSYSKALFLVHAESVENEYVATRPFRVNAGPVHAYVLCPNNKTKYLSDLKAGDKVLAVSSKGETREVIVGRAKIEKRPLYLLEADYKGETLRTILQNAETIRLVNEKGKDISIVNLKEGDKILVKIEDKARHFGMSIEETIIEK